MHRGRDAILNFKKTIWPFPPKILSLAGRRTSSKQRRRIWRTLLGLGAPVGKACARRLDEAIDDNFDWHNGYHQAAPALVQASQLMGLAWETEIRGNLDGGNIIRLSPTWAGLSCRQALAPAADQRQQKHRLTLSLALLAGEISKEKPCCLAPLCFSSTPALQPSLVLPALPPAPLTWPRFFLVSIVSFLTGLSRRR